jgi:hypothetical protein
MVIHDIMNVFCLQDFPAFGKSLIEFGLVGIPAAIVNSGLKYIQKKIEISFQVKLGLTVSLPAMLNVRSCYVACFMSQNLDLNLLVLPQSRLTEYLHKQYCSNRAYYAASNLGGMTFSKDMTEN